MNSSFQEELRTGKNVFNSTEFSDLIAKNQFGSKYLFFTFFTIYILDWLYNFFCLLEMENRQYI